VESRFRLTEIDYKLGIYQDGVGYIVDPMTTLFFNYEIRRMFFSMIKGKLPSEIDFILIGDSEF